MERVSGVAIRLGFIGFRVRVRTLQAKSRLQLARVGLG